MLDLQHLPNIKDGKRLLKGFEVNQSIAIAISSHEHKRIKHRDYSNVQNARTLLAREIKTMRKYTGIPSVAFIKIIEANK